MRKILFPEANNEYIRTAAEALQSKQLCEPLVAAADPATACTWLREGMADGLVMGVDCSSRDVILAARDQLGQSGETFSSLFVADLPTGTRYIVADGATCKHPTAQQLADIVILVHDAATALLNETPRIAMLSFSTFGSGGHDDTINVIREAIQIVRGKHPEIHVDGEMQLDAAVNQRIANKKAPGKDDVAGRANVLITPDINAGNILYKSLEQFAGARLAGPILLGFNHPVADLSRGSTADDIVFTAECLARLV